MENFITMSTRLSSAHVRRTNQILEMTKKGIEDSTGNIIFSLYEPHVPAPWVFWDIMTLLSQGLEWVQRRAAGIIKVWTSSVRNKSQHEKEIAEKGIQWRPLQPLATQRINENNCVLQFKRQQYYSQIKQAGSRCRRSNRR